MALYRLTIEQLQRSDVEQVADSFNDLFSSLMGGKANYATAQVYQQIVADLDIPALITYVNQKEAKNE